MSALDTSTPAVVLVCHHHVGLGIVRSLGRLGVPCYGVDADRFSPALWSKYCRGRLILDLHNASPDKSLRLLGRFGAGIGRRSVLIPTSDAAATFVGNHAEALRRWFIFPDVDPSLVRQLCNKQEMYHLARQFGVATPETVFPRSRVEAVEFCRTASFPILIKPILHKVPAFHPSMKRWRMRLVSTPEELLRSYDDYETPAAPNVMLQEYIPGGDDQTWTFNGYFDRQGQCRVAFTGRKLRNFPPYLGQASLALCLDNEEVKRITVNLMSAIGYSGPLDIGYRFDARDGRYKLNDVNPRVGAMFRLFVGTNGMDVVRATYQDLTGQPIEYTRNPHGRKWTVEDVDLMSALRYWHDGRMTAKEWLRSVQGVDEHTFVCRDDSWPLLSVCLLDARRMISGGLRSAGLTSSDSVHGSRTVRKPEGPTAW